MTILFQQNHHFITFYSYAFGGRGLQKEYVLFARDNDEKRTTPKRKTVSLSCNNSKASVFGKSQAADPPPSVKIYKITFAAAAYMYIFFVFEILFLPTHSNIAEYVYVIDGGTHVR